MHFINIQKWALMFLKREIFNTLNWRNKSPGILALYLSDLARVINVSNRTLSDRTRPKILTFKQIFQGLPAAPAQVKASDTSENLLNEIR